MSEQQFNITPEDDLFDLTGSAPVITTAPANESLGIAERTMIVGGAATPITTVQGVTIGEVAGNYLRVFVAQLRLPEEGGLRSGYDYKADKRFDALKESVNQTGINIEPLVVEVTGEVLAIDGLPRPLLVIRSGERRYWALKELAKPEALVRVLPQDMASKSQLLFTLIQNEMREPLPLLDRCDLVAMLYEEHKMKQGVIAAHLGYSQGQVSKLYSVACQPTLIRTFVAGDSLKLDTVETLQKAIPDDEELRKTVARYIVQENINGNALDALLLDILPPAGLQPRFALIAPPPGVENARVVMNSLLDDGNKQDEKKPPAPRKALPYWKRTTPLKASPVRLLNNLIEATVSGPPSKPIVNLDTLAGPQLFRQLERKHETTVDLEALEEAYLADLEAIRAALEDGGNEPTPVQFTRVVDALPDKRLG